MKTIVDFKKLELFRDFTLSLSELNESGKIDLFNSETANGCKILVCSEHVIKALNKYKEKKITQLNLLEWIYTIRFTDLFEVCEEYHESILNVFEEIQRTNSGSYGGISQGSHVWHIDISKIVNGNNLEEIKIIRTINDEDISKYKNAILNNIEL